MKLVHSHSELSSMRPMRGLFVTCILAQLASIQALLHSRLQKPHMEMNKEGGLQAMLERGAKQLSLEDALHAAKPPQTVWELLQRTHVVFNQTSGKKQFPGYKGGPDVSEEEVKSSINKLNLMAVKAQERLDMKSLDCKEFEEDNLRVLEHIEQDVARIHTEQSATLARLAGARESLSGVDGQRQVLNERHAEEDKVLQRRLKEAQDHLSRTESNMKISEFMLDMTKCTGAVLLSGVKSKHVSAGFKVCQESADAFQVEFEDTPLQNLTKRLTPDGQWQLQLALGRSRVSSRGLLADHLAKDGVLEVMEDGIELLNANPTSQKPFDERMANKCTIDTAPNCGEMHDVFVSLWGDMKDSVENLKDQVQEIEHDRDGFASILQHELAALGQSQSLLEATVVDITALQAELDGELANKAGEKARLQQFALTTKQECTTTLDEIIMGEMCGIRKVRSELVELLEGSQEYLVDCQVEEWQKPSSCSKICDGGEQTFKRKIVRKGSELGTSCPKVEMVAKCNDISCPVDCKLGSWAAWSKCTSACGGGVRYRTRARDINPKNGGFACDVLQETQQCNTGACDRNCQLGEWSSFSRCSQACDTGFRVRRKSVLQPEIGAGRCYEKDSSERMNRKECNKNKCSGNEKCTSKLDLIFAIDASGSMTEQGFGVLQTFAAKIVRRLKGGEDMVRAGVVQFGNGALDSDKVVSDVAAVLPLSTDIDSAESSILGLQFQRGFTNLAQAAMKSRDLLRLAPHRDGAERVVVLLTDGRPSFKHMASPAIAQLKKLARVMVVQVKTFPEKHNMELLKAYASEPSEVNYLHIAGKSALKNNFDAFATKLIVQACQSVEGS
jgi:hypothetical protein